MLVAQTSAVLWDIVLLIMVLSVTVYLPSEDYVKGQARWTLIQIQYPKPWREEPVVGCIADSSGPSI
jgi:hypothetical protein